MPARKPISARVAAGVIVLRAGATGGDYLLLRAYSYWDFPKGELASGGSLLAAALRELQEETGIAASDIAFPWGDIAFVTTPYAHGKVAHYFLARLAARVSVTLGRNPALGRAEHHEYRWVDYPAARPLLVPRLQRILDQAHAVVTA